MIDICLLASKKLVFTNHLNSCGYINKLFHYNLVTSKNIKTTQLRKFSILILQSYLKYVKSIEVFQKYLKGK